MDDTTAIRNISSIVAEAASLIRQSRYLTAFTGAGVSVESGIPPFRGEGGLWSTYDLQMLKLDYFRRHPERSWPILKEIFYDHFGQARPNRAHEVLAVWEARGWPRAPGSSERGFLQVLITQNVDNLHHITGSLRTLALACQHRCWKSDPAVLN